MRNDLITLWNTLINNLQDKECDSCKKSNSEKTDDIELFNQDGNKIDILDNVQYNEFKEKLAELRKAFNDNVLFNSFSDYFNSIIDNVIRYAEEYREKHMKGVKKEAPKEDKVEKAIESPKPVIELPSSDLPISDKLNIHKLVGEYINNYIRPAAAQNGWTNDYINDLYAYLFEYSCWLRRK